MTLSESEISTINHRSLWSRLWSGLLSLLFPGLGQIFAGRYKAGIFFFVSISIAEFLLYLTPYLWPRVPGSALLGALYLLIIIIIGVKIYAAINALAQTEKAPRFSRWRRYGIYAAFIFVSVAMPNVFLSTIKWKAYSAPSASMLPTIHVGDYFFALRDFTEHPPQRGDLAVFRLPRDPSVEFIKRVIGLPGDTVQMKDGRLFINGAIVAREKIRSYTEDKTTYTEYSETLPDGVSYHIIELGDNSPLDNTALFTVPAGRYFMLGDNRDNSSDSRDPSSGVGYVPVDNLVGRPAVVYFSYRHTSQPAASASFDWGRIGLTYR